MLVHQIKARRLNALRAFLRSVQQSGALNELELLWFLKLSFQYTYLLTIKRYQLYLACVVSVAGRIDQTGLGESPAVPTAVPVVRVHTGGRSNELQFTGGRQWLSSGPALNGTARNPATSGSLRRT